MMKNAYFILKTVLVLKMFKCVCRLFDYIKTGLIRNIRVNFKINNVTVWLTNSYFTHIAQYFTK